MRSPISARARTRWPFTIRRIFASLLNCVHLSAASAAELEKAGIGAHALPEVNFSKARGFFIIGINDAASHWPSSGTTNGATSANEYPQAGCRWRWCSV